MTFNSSFDAAGNLLGSCMGLYRHSGTTGSVYKWCVGVYCEGVCIVTCSHVHT